MKKLLLPLFIFLMAMSARAGMMPYVQYGDPCDPGSAISQSATIWCDNDCNGIFDMFITIPCDGPIKYWYWGGAGPVIGAGCEIGQIPQGSGPAHVGDLSTNQLSSGAWAFRLPILSASNEEICAVTYTCTSPPSTTCPIQGLQ